MVIVAPVFDNQATALHIKKFEHQLLKYTKVIQNELHLQEVAHAQEVGTIWNKVTIKAYKKSKNKKAKVAAAKAVSSFLDAAKPADKAVAAYESSKGAYKEDEEPEQLAWKPTGMSSN
jgi:hypothetical protein